MIKTLFMMFCICTFTAHAENMNQAYQEGKNIANSHASDSIGILKALDVTQLPGYMPTLSQEQYYKGVTPKGTDLESASRSATNQNDMANAVTHSFNNRPDFKINTNSESFRRLDTIAENGDAIMHGQDTEKTKCTLKPKTCTYAWQEQKCLTGKKLASVSCTRKLEIELIPLKTESLSMYVRKYTNSSQPMQINLLKPDTCKTSINCYTLLKDGAPVEPLVISRDCARMKISISDAKGKILDERQTSCSSPAIELPSTCIFGKCSYVQASLLTVEMYQEKEYLFDNCVSLKLREQEGFCRIKEPLHCVEPNETRVIEDISYTRSCWKEKAIYSCGGSTENTCENLVEKGCEQSASVCIREGNEQCHSWQQTYQCPVNQCTENQLVCGKDSFCLDGNCDSHDAIPADEQEFKKAVTILSAATEGARDLDGKGDFVFKGQRLECSRVMLGAKNCCREKGWGIDMNLFHCSDQEKQLGKARENNLVVPTGEYCFKRKRFPGGSVCVDHHQTYCVFQSRLARIVQEQGRRNQLGIGFGQGEFSNCSGITPNQLQMIQFERIDFSEFYQDIKNRQKKPDEQKTAEGIGKRIGDYYTRGEAHE